MKAFAATQAVAAAPVTIDNLLNAAPLGKICEEDDSSDKKSKAKSVKSRDSSVHAKLAEWMKPQLPCLEIHPIHDDDERKAYHSILYKVLKYYTELQIWEEMNEDRTPVEFDGLMMYVAEKYRVKLQEVLDLTVILKTLKKHKHQILLNISGEFNFKVDLDKILGKKSEVPVPELLDQQMTAMKEMFATLTGEIRDIKTSVRSLES